MRIPRLSDLSVWWFRNRCIALLLLSLGLIINGSQAAVALPQPLVQTDLAGEGTKTGSLRLGRWVDAGLGVDALVIQLAIPHRYLSPQTELVYRVYARRTGQWVQVYSRASAVKVDSQTGEAMLPLETIQFDRMRLQRAGKYVPLSDLELKVSATVRSNLFPEELEPLAFEVTQPLEELAPAPTAQLAMNRDRTQTIAEIAPAAPAPLSSPEPAKPGAFRETESPLAPSPRSRSMAATRFNLAILQQSVTLSEVVARLSLKPKTPTGYGEEQFIGDFRYRTNQRAEFITGMNTRDRIVVRLFNVQNQLIGYSEFELLPENTTVQLILPVDATKQKIVRTLVGQDADRDGRFDANARLYDYVSQAIAQPNGARVVFPETLAALTIDPSHLKVYGLPTPIDDCRYPASFMAGDGSLRGKALPAFPADLEPILASQPGELVRSLSISPTSVALFEVNNLIEHYQSTQTPAIDADLVD